MAPHHGANSIVTRRVPSPRNNAVTRGNKTPPPFHDPSRHALCLHVRRWGVYRACASARSHKKIYSYFSHRRARNTQLWRSHFPSYENLSLRRRHWTHHNWCVPHSPSRRYAQKKLQTSARWFSTKFIDARSQRACVYSLPQRSNNHITCAPSSTTQWPVSPASPLPWGGALHPNKRGYYYYYYYLFYYLFVFYANPYPPPSLLLLTSTTGRLMIASQARRRFWLRGWRWRWRQKRGRRTLGWVKTFMRNRR